MIRIKILIISTLLVFSVDQVRAQGEAAVRHLFQTGELKKLEKAERYKQDADRVMEEVNLLNIQIQSIEADSGVPRANIRRKVAPMENQAWQKLTQASSLYEKCNEIKIEVYKQSIEKYWDKNPGSETTRLNEKLLEEQARDLYFQAESYRTDARRMNDGQTKASRLTDANNLESEAIDKLLGALAGCYGIERESIAVPSEPEVAEADISGAESLADSVLALLDSTEQSYTLPVEEGINRDEIERYNRYIREGQRTDTSLSTGRIAGITSFERDTVLTLWYDYIYGRSDSGRTIALVRPEKSSVTEASAKVPEETKKPELTDTETEIGVVNAQNVGTMVPADEEVIYRVQIAAYRTELSQRALSRMYYGNKNVEMVNENGWFKYSVGDFSTFAEADKFRQASSLSNGFVVAYRKGTRFKDAGSSETFAKEEVTSADTASTLPEGLIFRIQVAASKVPLNIAQLEQISGTRYPVEMIREDGWYKYQLMGVRLFSEILRIKEGVTARGAFVVAYQDGHKIRLADAVNLNRSAESTSGPNASVTREIEYHVQLAATKRAMRPSEIKSLYAGSHPVTLLMEEGWYKYQLKTGNSFREAQELRQACGVSGAFIVAYRNAVKISLRDATQGSK